MVLTLSGGTGSLHQGDRSPNTQALLARLEAGVHVPRSEQREVVRLLYVATRHQVKALADCYSGRVGLQCKSHCVVCTLPLG
jgi:hypothetical protein